MINAETQRIRVTRLRRLGQADSLRQKESKRDMNIQFR
jgi:hypothetical protein